MHGKHVPRPKGCLRPQNSEFQQSLSFLAVMPILLAVSKQDSAEAARRSGNTPDTGAAEAARRAVGGPGPQRGYAGPGAQVQAKRSMTRSKKLCQPASVNQSG